MKLNQTKPQNEILDVKKNQESQENQETFYFYSASLGRRVLSYLADIFISFILCVFVFEIIYWPITKPCISYEKKVFQTGVIRGKYSCLCRVDNLEFDTQKVKKYLNI